MPIHCHYFNIDCILLSYFVIYNFVFLMILILILLDPFVKQVAVSSSGGVRTVPSSHPPCSSTSHEEGSNHPLCTWARRLWSQCWEERGADPTPPSLEDRRQTQDEIIADPINITQPSVPAGRNTASKVTTSQPAGHRGLSSLDW